MRLDILARPPSSPDQRIRYGEDLNQFLDLWSPAEPRAVAMMIHGGFWRVKYDLLHTSHFCAALAKKNIAVGNLEYRRVGNVGGGWPGTYHDAQAGLLAIRQCFQGQTKVLVVGHSAGGHLALRLAVDATDLAGVVALAPVAVLKTAYDLHLSNDAVVDFLGGTPNTVPDVYETACPSRHSSSVERILVHGTQDEVVPVSLTDEFCEARKEDSGTVSPVKIAEARHFDLIDPESGAWSIVLTAIGSLL